VQQLSAAAAEAAREMCATCSGTQGPVACLVDIGAHASVHAAAPSTGWGMVFKHALVLCGG